MAKMNAAQKQAAAQANLAKLPEYAAVRHPMTNEVVLVKRGETGYWPNNTGRSLEDFNALFNVSPQQAEAMKIGSIMGWHVPGADPENPILAKLG
jgi:hypothetical protein